MGYRSNARHLIADGTLARTKVVSIAPRLLRAAFERWATQGATSSVIAGRSRALRAAVGWAYDERIIDHHPIRNLRGPGRLEPRRPLTETDLHALLWTAEANLLAAVANDDRHPGSN